MFAKISSFRTVLQHPSVRLISYLIVPLLFMVVYITDTIKKPMIMMPLFAALLGFFVAVQWPRKSVQPEPILNLNRWIRASAIMGGGLLMLLLSEREYLRIMLYKTRPFGFWVSVAITVVVLLILLVRPPRPAFSLGLLTIGGLSIRAWNRLQFPLDPIGSDMVPLIYSAVETFLAGGNPYAFHQMQTNSEVPLTYPPGLWLAHVPPFLLDIDIRWTGWVSDAIVILAIGYAALRWTPRVFGPVFLALTAYTFSPVMHWAGIYGEPHFDWAVIALLFVAVMSRRPNWAGAAYGVALLTRPFNVLFAPFICLWLWHQFGARAALRSLLISGLIAAVVYVPFVAPDPSIFYVGTVRWLLEYGPIHEHWFRGTLGFSGPLNAHKLGAWLLPIQLGGLVVLTLLSAWKLRTTTHLVIFCLLIYAHFIAFNALIWVNFWVGVLIIATTLLIASKIGEQELEQQDVPPKTTAATPRWLLAGEIVATLIVVGSLTFLLSALYGYFSQSGRDALQNHLNEQAKSGDLILDRVAYRKAFLKKSYLFGRSELASGLRLAEDPFTQVLPRRTHINPLQPQRIWVAERYDLFEPFAQFYLGDDGKNGPYTVKSDQQFGRFRLLELERVAQEPHRPISANAQQLTVAAVVGPKAERREATWTTDRWIFEGAQGWQYIGQTTCNFYGVSRKMLWAHPWADTSLEISMERPPETTTLSLIGGLNDKAATWLAPPVILTLRSQDRVLQTIEFPNLPGLNGTNIVLPDDAKTLTFSIATANPGRRHFCVDAMFF